MCIRLKMCICICIYICIYLFYLIVYRKFNIQFDRGGNHPPVIPMAVSSCQDVP